jgi:hypothetical protein
MATFDINIAGFIIAGLVVPVWLIAIAYWSYAKNRTPLDPPRERRTDEDGRLTTTPRFGGGAAHAITCTS